jgi:hypothetical protein
MKTKQNIVSMVVPMPNSDLFMVQNQYVKGGAITTDNNNGKGYTLEQAQEKTIKKKTV